MRRIVKKYVVYLVKIVEHNQCKMLRLNLYLSDNFRGTYTRAVFSQREGSWIICWHRLPKIITRNKMAVISQTTLSNVFSWMKMLEFRLKFYWCVFLRVQLTIFQHWFRWWLGADQATSYYLNQWWLDYLRIYASLGLNELRHWWTHRTFGIHHHNREIWE